MKDAKKEHVINYPSWAPVSLIDKREEFLKIWTRKAEEYHFKPLPVAQDVTQLFDHLLTEPEMEVVWSGLLKRADTFQIRGYPEILLNEIFTAIIMEDSFVDSMPEFQRHKHLTVMKNQAIKLKQAAECLKFDGALKPIYRKKMNSSRLNSKFTFEEIKLSDLLEEIYSLAVSFSNIPGYLHKTSSDHGKRRCEILIRFLELHFQQFFNLHLDDVLVRLARIIFDITYTRDSIRGKRQLNFDPSISPSEKRQAWPP